MKRAAEYAAGRRLSFLDGQPELSVGVIWVDPFRGEVGYGYSLTDRWLLWNRGQDPEVQGFQLAEVTSFRRIASEDPEVANVAVTLNNGTVKMLAFTPYEVIESEPEDEVERTIEEHVSLLTKLLEKAGAHHDETMKYLSRTFESRQYFVIHLTLTEDTPFWGREEASPWADVAEVASSHQWKLAYSRTPGLAAAMEPHFAAKLVLAPGTSESKAATIASGLRSAPSVVWAQVESEQWDLLADAQCLSSEAFRSRPGLFVELLYAFYLFDPVEIGVSLSFLVNNASEYAGQVRDLIEILPHITSEADVAQHLGEICEAGGNAENINRLARVTWATWQASGASESAT